MNEQHLSILVNSKFVTAIVSTTEGRYTVLVRPQFAVAVSEHGNIVDGGEAHIMTGLNDEKYLAITGSGPHDEPSDDDDWGVLMSGEITDIAVLEN